MLIGVKEDIQNNEGNLITLPKGEYVTLNFDDDYNDTSKYYKKIIDYIDINNIKVSGYFYEIYNDYIWDRWEREVFRSNSNIKK